MDNLDKPIELIAEEIFISKVVGGVPKIDNEYLVGTSMSLPKNRCRSCGGNKYWQRATNIGGGKVCPVCHPPVNGEKIYE